MSDRTALLLMACAVVTVVATLAAVGAGYLARRDHASYPTAVTRAACAFASTLTLAAAVTTALAALGR